MKVSLICALGTNGAIGRGNELLWRISEDLQRFKRLTTGHSIIMGRKTYESIGRPLPNRTNIIITRDESYKAEGCVVVHSLDAALAVAAKKIDVKSASSAPHRGPSGNMSGSLSGAEMPHDGPATDEIFIIGGGEIYKQSIDIADRLYLTLVDDAPVDADTFFPEYNDFTNIVECESGISGNLNYKYVVLDR